jgi:AAA domain
MPNVNDIVLGGRIMALFISDNGNGKTVAAASFPGPIKFYDFDGRMQPVKLFYPHRKDITYDLVGMEAQRPSGSFPGCIGLMDFAKEYEDLQDRCPWETVVIDSITALTATVVGFQLGIKSKEGKGKKLSSGIQVPSWDEFNGETSVVQQVLDVSKVLPCHVIFTAHPVDKSIDMGGGTLKKARSIAAYGTKTPSLVPIYFNEIYQFGVEPPSAPGEPAQRFILTQPTGKDMAKTALPLPPRIDITNKPLYPLLKKYCEDHNVKLQEREASLAK